MAPVIFHCSSTLACAGSVWQRYSRLAVSQRSYFSSLRPKSAPNEVRMARRQVLYRSTAAQLQRSSTSQSARAKALQGVTRWHWSGVRGRDQVAGSALIDASRGSLGTVLQRVTKCVEIAVPGGSLAVPGLLRSRGGDRKEPDVLVPIRSLRERGRLRTAASGRSPTPADRRTNRARRCDWYHPSLLSDAIATHIGLNQRCFARRFPPPRVG